jgi:hypothetical protein
VRECGLRVMKRRWIWSIAALALCIAFFALAFGQGEPDIEFVQGQQPVHLSAIDVGLSDEGDQSGEAYCFKSDFGTAVERARNELTQRGYEEVTTQLGEPPRYSAYFARGDVKSYISSHSTRNPKSGDVDVVILQRDFGYRVDGNRLIGLSKPGNVSVFVLRARGQSLIGRLRSCVGL